MSEREALLQASVAMEERDAEKARAILDRFDDARELGDADNKAEPEIRDSGGSGAKPSEMASTFRRTSAHVLSAFTVEETTEEDIGGYYYDLAFVLDTLKSKSFLLIGMFVAVFAGVFTVLYQGAVSERCGGTSSRVCLRPSGLNRSMWSPSTRSKCSSSQ